MWKLILKGAVMLGLHEWAKSKAEALIRKGLDKLTHKAKAQADAVQSAKVDAVVKKIEDAKAALGRQ